jgi:hypothetical protein
MRKQSILDPSQLGFDSLLQEAETTNRAKVMDKTLGHLPETMEEALPFYHDLIRNHHDAMLAGDQERVFALREDAGKLALKLNKGEPGIIAGPEAPGTVLEQKSAAEDGAVPLWGQSGSFIITVHDTPVRIRMDGLFGIGARYMPWMNFAAHAVDWHRPFISETGFRSFMGLYAALVPGMTPDTFAKQVIEIHVGKMLKGKLVSIDANYRP